MSGTPFRTVARKSASLLAAALFAWAACAATARAAGVADYRARVDRAAGLLEGLAARSWDYDETTSGARAAASASTFSEVRALLPVRETVETGAARGGVEVSHAWLHAELARCERLRVEAVERKEILGAVAERLRANASRLGEYERVAPAPRDKEAEKGRLAAILRQPEYAPRGSGESAVERLWKRFTDWLRQLFPSFGPLKPGTDRRATTVAQVLVYALAAALILYVARRLWRRRGLTPSPAARDEERVVLGEKLAPELRAADLLEEAERRARAGDLRGAIRRSYMALLVELGDRRVLRLARHKTNRDYLRAVGERAAHLYGLVHPLTADFERHWYGREEATPDDWSRFRAGCRQAISRS